MRRTVAGLEHPEPGGTPVVAHVGPGVITSGAANAAHAMGSGTGRWIVARTADS